MTRTASRATALLVTATALLAIALPAQAAVPPVTGSGTGSIIAAAATSPIALAATARPNEVVFSSDGTKAFVANGFTNNISVIDVATSTVSTIALGTEPRDIAISPDGAWLYAPDFSQQIYKVSTSTYAVTTFSLGLQIRRIAVGADGTRVYGVSANSLEVLDAATGATIASVALGFNLGSSLEVSPDGLWAYAGSIGDNKIVAVYLPTNAVTTITGAGQYPAGLAFSPDGSKLYATAQLDNSVSIIDTATNTVATTGIAAGAHPTNIVVSSNGLYGYVSDNGSDTMTVLDLTANAAIHTLATGTNPNGIAVSPDGSRVFVADYSSAELSAFDVTKLAFTGQGEVASGADATFALALTNGDSPIANYTGGNAVVELLNGSNAVVATGPGVAPSAVGTANAHVSTTGLAPGTYTVRITFTDPDGVVVARAADFTIAGVALAATGSNSAPILAVAALLVLGGTVLLFTRPGAGRRRAASGRRTSR